MLQKRHPCPAFVVAIDLLNKGNDKSSVSEPLSGHGLCLHLSCVSFCIERCVTHPVFRAAFVRWPVSVTSAPPSRLSATWPVWQRRVFFGWDFYPVCLFSLACLCPWSVFSFFSDHFVCVWLLCGSFCWLLVAFGAGGFQVVRVLCQRRSPSENSLQATWSTRSDQAATRMTWTSLRTKKPRCSQWIPPLCSFLFWEGLHPKRMLFFSHGHWACDKRAIANDPLLDFHFLGETLQR